MRLDSSSSGGRREADRTVLQVNKYYPPVVGGIEAAVASLAEGLAERSHDIRVIASRQRGLGRVDRVRGVDVRRVLSLGELASSPVAPTYPLEYRRAAGTADVVHHHLPNPVGVVSALLSGKFDAPVVATYHSDIVRQRAALAAYRPLLERFLDAVDRILVTSPRLRDSSPVLSGFEDKCTVVPLSLDPDRFTAVPERPSGFPVAPGDRFVLFAGRLSYYKGVEYLVRAAAELDDPVVVAGDGERAADLRRLARELGVGDRVHFLGRVSDAELRYCYEHASVFALPSVARSEAFGLVQLEAMAHGTPVVNTDLPTGVPWVSRDGETGLTVPPRDAEALAEALDRLLSDESLRREYADEAVSRVEREFSRERMVDDVVAVYDELTGDR